MAANRAKSKSPNPSFCSVLSRVKDWELGAFTPKTALADNVDVMNRSNVPFSDSDREMSDQGESKPPSGWTLGSPPREEAAGAAAATTGAAGAASAAVATNAAKVGAIATGGANGAAGKNVTSGLVKSALSSNIGELRKFHSWINDNFGRGGGALGAAVARNGQKTQAGFRASSFY